MSYTFVAYCKRCDTRIALISTAEFCSDYIEDFKLFEINKDVLVLGKLIIIDLLIELLNNTAGTENYSIKLLKLEQVKIETKCAEIFRKVTQALKEKNTGYHTYQLKAEKGYKIVIRGLHPRTNTKNIYMRN